MSEIPLISQSKNIRKLKAWLRGNSDKVRKTKK